MLSPDSVRKPTEVTSISGSSADENLWPMPNFSGLLTAALGGHHVWNLILLPVEPLDLIEKDLQMTSSLKKFQNCLESANLITYG